jgi:hypothetical protein
MYSTALGYQHRDPDLHRLNKKQLDEGIRKFVESDRLQHGLNIYVSKPVQEAKRMIKRELDRRENKV